MKWLTEVLPDLGSTWNIELSPLEQLAAFIETYASGEPLVFGRSFKPISHVSGGVWELKTADLRVFGWFPSQDVFIGHAANLSETIKSVRGMYHGYANEVVHYRKNLDLNEPKFVPGDDPNAVVSAFSYP